MHSRAVAGGGCEKRRDQPAGGQLSMEADGGQPDDLRPAILVRRQRQRNCSALRDQPERRADATVPDAGKVGGLLKKGGFSGMTGKDMLQGIQNLDAELIEESEFGTFGRGKARGFGKKKLLLILAAALIMLTPWHKDRIFVDPFCGSGTFPIEAAMMAANIAPGMNREFTAEQWENLIPKKEWYMAIEEANDNICMDIETDIQGFDLDENVIKIARQNAVNAGVDKLIHFQARDVRQLSHAKKYGFVITNPPYGERLEEKEALPALYTALGQQFAKLDSWSAYVITSYTDIEKYFGRKADKNRKIYNGMLKTYFYSFLGPKPPKKNV